MIKKTFILLALAATLLTSALPASSVDNEAVMRCLLREVLAVLTCKSVDDFRFVGKRDEVYVFNAFFAAKNTEFYCQVFDRDVVVTSRAWEGHMGSARITYESQPGCLSASVDAPVAECRVKRVVQCCGSD
ncbi:hypothetical protein NNJEOMEG_01206 [Fundidesulfovibrio magnetotacticus]|uniref:Uncharacterized protein n=1 Tax=Fundidesulfovibrio magnetotacticus TaxID=2730080 RepID=A0A6V8LNU8_9BACT|nr:hypothetical protein [Fundidesulfovibrio magnetotacticus]GFK93374.1 hypothetical protein NNJEOMEG_01206 [Fundidesulfovibrio magnetotacticus]